MGFGLNGSNVKFNDFRHIIILKISQIHKVRINIGVCMPWPLSSPNVGLKRNPPTHRLRSGPHNTCSTFHRVGGLFSGQSWVNLNQGELSGKWKIGGLLVYPPRPIPDFVPGLPPFRPPLDRHPIIVPAEQGFTIWENRKCNFDN